MSLTISVVVCAHDEGRWPELQAAVHSLEEQSLQPHEIIVVVDRNPQLATRACRQLSAAVVENTGTPGLGGARNSGLEAASAEIVAFLDDDAIASGQWLELLEGGYDDPNVAGVGGSAQPLWETERPRWFPPEFDWVVGCSYLGMPETAKQVRNMFGCNMSFRRDLVRELGGFRLGYGCDETELCIRLRQRWPEKKLLYVPEACVLHHVPASRMSFARFLSRCFFEGGSKAVVSRLVGSSDALASERDYIRRVLPAGIRRGLVDAVGRGRVSGAARAGAIVAGLASTAVGYAAARLTIERAAERRGWSGRLERHGVAQPQLPDP
ncbi:MAG: glycosyltransferase family 2 protein [Gaiellaceae bacterium]